MWFTKDTGADPAYPGEQTYNAGNFRSMDQLGVYNPRDVWAAFTEGPTPNLAANCYCTVSYVSGTPFVSSVAWYRDAAKTQLLVLQAYAYSGTAYLTPTSVRWTLYNAAGTAISSCTDTYNYSGVFLTGASRAYT